MDVAGAQLSIIIEFRVEPESLPAFLELLRRNSRDTLAADGCFRTEISVPEGHPPGTVFLTELLRDQAAIEAHRAKPGHDVQHTEINAMLIDKHVAKGSTIAL